MIYNTLCVTKIGMLRHVRVTSHPVCERAEKAYLVDAAVNNGTNTVCGRSGTLQTDGHTHTGRCAMTDQSRE